MSSFEEQLLKLVAEMVEPRLEEIDRRLRQVESDPRHDADRSVSKSVGLINASEAAERLGVSERKLWELTNSGVMACVRIGRAVRYCPQELARWVEQGLARSKKGR